MIDIGNVNSADNRHILEIRDRNGRTKARYTIGEKDYLYRKLMGEHYIEISFFLNSYVAFVRGDYIEYEGGRYFLREWIKVEQQSKIKYKYTLRFEATECFFSDIQMFYLNQGRKESGWQMTSFATHFLQIVVDNINRYFGNELCRVGVVEPTEIKEIQIDDNTTVAEALGKIAEAFGCEWQYVSNTINLVGSLSYGANIELELDRSLRELKIDGSRGKRYNRIVALGGDRNIPNDYRKSREGEAVDAILQKRLRIPIERGSYVSLSDDFANNEVVEGVVVFNYIYPKRVGTVEGVSWVEYTDTDMDTGKKSKWKAYKIKDSGIDFKEEYLLPGKELRIAFQSGRLNGRDFAVIFHKDRFSGGDNSQCFEIRRESEQDYNIPNETLSPSVGDRYVLYGFNISLVSEQYVRKAEVELYNEAIDFLRKQEDDSNTYECITSIEYFKSKKLNLEIGQRVRVINSLFSKGYKDSRIISYEKKLYNKYDALYIVGDKPNYNKIEKIEKDIKELKRVEANISNSTGNSVYIIKQYDNTKATDFNVYSALATDNKYVSKNSDNEVSEHITFADGLTTLNAIVRELATIKGLSVTDIANITRAVISGEIKSDDYSNTDGFKIFRGANGWNIEIDHITARKTFKTLELVVQRVVHQGGMIVQSPAGGTLVSYERENPAMWVFKVDTEDSFVPGDFVLCQTFTAGKAKRYWRLVDNYYPESKTIFIHKNDCERGSDVPEVGDHIAVLGNKIDRTRQSARVICMIGANSPYVADYAGIDSYTLEGRLINQIGNLSGVSDPTFGGNLSGVGLYTKNLYAKGNIRLQSGESIEDYTARKMQEAKRESEKISGAYYSKTIDATELDPNKYYPVFILLQKNGKRSHIKLSRQLDRNYNLNGEKPPYSWHTHGFSYNLEWEVTANQWGSYDMNRKIKNIGGVFTDYNKIAGDISQFTQMSVEVVYVRGGSKYDVSVLGAGSTDVRFPNDIIELHPRGYTYDSHIKGNRSFTGGNEEQARRWYGDVDFPVKDSVVAPQVTDVEEAVSQAVELVKAGISVENGRITLFGHQISVLGTAHFEALQNAIGGRMSKREYTEIDGGKIKTSMLKADEILAGQVFTDRLNAEDITAKKIEVKDGESTIAIIDAGTKEARLGVGAKIGDLVINNVGLRSVNKPYKIETDRAGHGLVAHLSTWGGEPAVWGQDDNGIGIFASSQNHTQYHPSNAQRLAIKGNGGAKFNTAKYDHWRVPGVLWCGHIDGSGAIRSQWGDGITTISVRRLGTGHYIVEYGNDKPQVAYPQVTANNSDYWLIAQTLKVTEYGFELVFNDAKQGAQDTWFVLTIMGVPKEK